MNGNFKQIPWLILAIGFAIYVLCVIGNTNVETYTGLTLMITLSIWACIHILLDSFKITEFIKVFAGSGYLFAITVFFFSGVEEVSFPEGAIIFHFTQVVKSLGIAFLASLPLLIFYDNKQNSSNSVESVSADNDTSNETTPSNDSWEAATQEDLDSGQWELDS